MSEPIKRGDLVMLIRCCCDRQKAYLKTIFEVHSLRDYTKDHGLACAFCMADLGAHFAAWDAKSSSAPLKWLKRIDPGTLDEPTETHKELQC